MPQSRHRLYIVGVHNPVRGFKWPEPRPRVSLESVLDPRPEHHNKPEWPTSKTELTNLLHHYKKLNDKGIQAAECNAVADIGVSARWCNSGALSIGYSPCLTKAACQSNRYWVFSRQRKLHLSECLRLQGISPARIQLPEQVSENKLRGMAGNSFTVPLVASIVDRLLFSAGLTSQPIAFTAGTGQDGMNL